MMIPRAVAVALGLAAAAYAAEPPVPVAPPPDDAAAAEKVPGISAMPQASPTPRVTPAGPGEEHPLVAQARQAADDGRSAEALVLIEAYRKLFPDDPVARRLELRLRIEERRRETRSLLREHVEARGLVLGDPDYEAAKAVAAVEVSRRLSLVEYLVAQNKYNEAIAACEQVVKDYEDNLAGMILLDRLLRHLNQAEKDNLERARAVRNGELVNDVIRAGTMPREPAARPRPVVVFDEDLEAAEREKLMQRLALKVPGFNYKEAALADVLEELFAYAGLDYVILDGAIGDDTITAYLVDQSVSDILSVLQRMVKVQFNYHGGLIYITGTDNPILVTRIIRLASGLTDVGTKRKVQRGGGGGEGGEGGGGGGLDPLAGEDGGGEGGGKSDLDKFLKKLPELVDWPDGSTHHVDAKSNTLYLRSSAATCTEVERLLRALDYASTMILIETRFVEVQEDALQQLGVDWGVLGQDTRAAGGAIALGGVRGTNTLGAGSPEAALSSSLTASSAGGISLGVIGMGNGIKPNFSVVLQALQDKKLANTLSEPKILTLNNATGVIDISNDVAYLAGWENISVPNTVYDDDSTNNSSSYSNSLPTQKWETAQEFINLEVRPSIGRNSDTITLSLVPTIKEFMGLAGSSAATSIGGGANTVALGSQKPMFSQRTLNTIFHIQNGQTVVIGGLVSERDEKSKSGVPGLMNVPVLGRLFRTDKTQTTRSKLLIFVTAHLIDPSGARYADEVRYLSDTARVALPAAVRERLAEKQKLDAELAEKQAAEAAERQRAERDALDPNRNRGKKRP